jgi:hypothetical protein
VFFGTLASEGWLEIVSIRFVTFDELDLQTDSDDRIVWRLAQKNQMVLLTANRSMKGKDSLEQVMREESTAESGYQLKPKQADSARGWAEVTEKTVVAWVAP